MRLETITLGEAAKYLGVSRHTLYLWTCRKHPRFKEDFPKKIKLGKEARFLKEEIDEWMRQQIESRKKE